MLLELADGSPLLQLIDLDDGGQELEVVAGVAGELLEGLDVFWETIVRDHRAGGHERMRARHLEGVDRPRKWLRGR